LYSHQPPALHCHAQNQPLIAATQEAARIEKRIKAAQKDLEAKRKAAKERAAVAAKLQEDLKAVEACVLPGAILWL
jgi:septal ring factor EnvC (AmiA/AmiB activator)